jgi:hypothetical protein
VKLDENFSAKVWAGVHRDLQRQLEARILWWEAQRPRGILHEPSPAVVRRQLRLARRRRLRWAISDWWYRVRAPLRWAGGCREEE